MYRHILIPLENSPADETILAHIKPLARITGARLLLVHVADGWVARQRYDQAKAAFDSATAQLAAAEAQADVARNEAGYSLLLADADGTVVETLAEPGQVVAAGQTVVKLAHAGPREATVNLPETVRPAIGSSAEARVYGGASAPTPARLRQLSDAAEWSSAAFDDLLTAFEQLFDAVDRLSAAFAGLSGAVDRLSAADDRLWAAVE